MGSEDQQAIEARTSVLLEAVRRKDTAGIERLKAPEFTWVMSPDRVLNRTQARDFQAKSFGTFHDFTEFQYSIGPVRIVGDTAVAVVLIRAVFTSADPSGSSHVLAQTASHEDTWVRRGRQWLFARDRVLEIGMTRDGQPYDPLAELLDRSIPGEKPPPVGDFLTPHEKQLRENPDQPK